MLPWLGGSVAGTAHKERREEGARGLARAPYHMEVLKNLWSVLWYCLNNDILLSVIGYTAVLGLLLYIILTIVRFIRS